MELYNSEGGKLRKKDRTPYYYDKKKKFISVPSMKDDPAEIKDFLKFCITISHPDVSSKDFESVWKDAEDNMPKIIEGIEQLKAESEASGENTYKVIAYAKALKVLREIKVPIVSGYQAQKLSGIGPGIASVINEILKHGKLKTEEERVEEMAIRQDVVQKFVKIWGVTSKEATNWFYKGYREIEDLKNVEDLTEKQKMGIKYYKDFEEPISRETVSQIANFVSKTIGQPVSKLGMPGEDLYDVSLLIHGLKSGKTSLKSVLKKLQSETNIEEVNMTPKQLSAVMEYNGKYYRLELYILPDKDVGIFLLFSRTPKPYLDYLKEQAGIQNYRLDKKGLVKLSLTDDNDEVIATEDEEDIFITLGVDYIAPENRV